MIPVSRLKVSLDQGKNEKNLKIQFKSFLTFTFELMMTEGWPLTKNRKEEQYFNFRLYFEYNVTHIGKYL